LDKLKTNIVLFYSIALLQGMVFYGPVATLYRQSQGLSVFDMTLIESISLIVMIALEIPWGYLSDKIGYKKTIVLCSFLYFISKIIFWKADHFALFLMERLVLSVVLAGISGCDLAYLYLSAGAKDSQKVFGIYHAMSTTGLVIASIVFSVAVKNNYRLAALLTVATYGAAMFFSLGLTEVRSKTKKHMKCSEELKAIGISFTKNKYFIIFLLAAALLAESNQTITVFLSQLQYIRSGLLPKHMGYIYIVVTLSGLLSACSHRLTKRLGENTAIKVLFGAAAIACMVMGMFANPIVSIMGILFLRIAASLLAPMLMAIQNRQIMTTNRATMLSVYGMIMNVTAVFTNLILGKMADKSVKYAMMAAALFCFSGLILYSIWQSKIVLKK
jgi:MFS family permease